ncbi:MAG: hypothetical protein MPK62_13285, partial [Alphaproteobacteria bacterium]|nr:hypothetical protein [Alphaproteobacteria bacterium]
ILFIGLISKAVRNVPPSSRLALVCPFVTTKFKFPPPCIQTANSPNRWLEINMIKKLNRFSIG